MQFVLLAISCIYALWLLRRLLEPLLCRNRPPRPFDLSLFLPYIGSGYHVNELFRSYVDGVVKKLGENLCDAQFAMQFFCKWCDGVHGRCRRDVDEMQSRFA